MSGYYNTRGKELESVGQTGRGELMPVVVCAEGDDTCDAAAAATPKYQAFKMLRVPEVDEDTAWAVVVSTSTSLAQEYAVLPITVVLPPRKVEVLVEIGTTIGIFLACVIVFVILF